MTQAASFRCRSKTALPSSNALPSHTSWSRWGAFSFLNRFSATIRSFQIRAVALSTRLNRLAAELRSRTEAKGKASAGDPLSEDNASTQPFLCLAGEGQSTGENPVNAGSEGRIEGHPGSLITGDPSWLSCVLQRASPG